MLKKEMWVSDSGKIFDTEYLALVDENKYLKEQLKDCTTTLKQTNEYLRSLRQELRIKDKVF